MVGVRLCWVLFAWATGHTLLPTEVFACVEMPIELGNLFCYIVIFWCFFAHVITVNGTWGRYTDELGSSTIVGVCKSRDVVVVFPGACFTHW